MMGEKTKKLWENLEYRKHMSEVHKGHKKPKNAYSFPKGHKITSTPEIREQIRLSKLGEKNPRWNGGIIITSQGYKKIIKDNKKGRTNYILEHRKVMEEYLRRKLKKEEVVHHIDGNTLNNNINNLMLFSNVGKHTKFHHDKRKGVVL